jgi:hypothetical protein
MTNKICGIHELFLTCLILANMSWQAQWHFCWIIRYQDSFEKEYGNKTNRCGICVRLHENFKVYGSILEYINGIVMYAKGM